MYRLGLEINLLWLKLWLKLLLLIRWRMRLKRLRLRSCEDRWRLFSGGKIFVSIRRNFFHNTKYLER